LSKVARVVIAVAASAAVVWVGLLLFPSEERQIRGRLRELALAASLEGTETEMVRLTKAAQVSKYFAQDVVVDLGEPYPPIEGRDSLVAMAARAGPPGGVLQIEFVDVEVTVDADARTARVSLTAKATGRAPAGGRDPVDARELSLTLRKADGPWVISRIDVLRTLEPVS
jgi:hypothetical protein